MAWEIVAGQLVITWIPSALILTAAIIGALLVMRSLSLRILLATPDFRDRDRYVRGARWGWLLALVSFGVVVTAMIVLFGFSYWGGRAVMAAWMAALLPLAGSAGLLMLEELMGFCVGLQAGWDALHRQQLNLLAYRATTSQTMYSPTRWSCYAAWVMGSVGLTIGPLVTCISAQL